jgi:hypothetical protein
MQRFRSGDTTCYASSHDTRSIEHCQTVYAPRPPGRVGTARQTRHFHRRGCQVCVCVCARAAGELRRRAGHSSSSRSWNWICARAGPSLSAARPRTRPAGEHKSRLRQSPLAADPVPGKRRRRRRGQRARPLWVKV